MLCGLIPIRSKIKRFRNQLYLWLFRNRHIDFLCHHCCIGCQFFDDCMIDYNGMMMEAMEDKTIVEGPIDLYEDE